MALAFHYRELYPVGETPARVALLPGAWNPPTVAHLAMARAALKWADEVVLVLPRTLPHKEFEGVAFQDRVKLLASLASTERGLSAATSDGGLYLEIATEAALAFPPETEIGLVCGRDAAERIAAWDYGRPGVFDEMLLRYPLLVAERSGHYQTPEQHRDRVIHLPLDPDFHEVSSSEIRRRIASGEPWESLVPPSIAAQVADLYRVNR